MDSPRFSEDHVSKYPERVEGELKRQSPDMRETRLAVLLSPTVQKVQDTLRAIKVRQRRGLTKARLQRVLSLPGSGVLETDSEAEVRAELESLIAVTSNGNLPLSIY